jgi:hypothetical protein
MRDCGHRTIGCADRRHDDKVRTAVLRPVILSQLSHTAATAADQFTHDLDIVA